MATVSFIGPGRAGSSLARALSRVGWSVLEMLGRDEPVAGVARDVDLVVVSTPDRAVPVVARSIEPTERAVVVHLSGSLGLDALAPHPRVGSLHPLVTLPDATIGADRLLSGAFFAVSGDPLTRRLATDLGGTPIEVDEDRRPAYHAAACIASNHVVALLGQAERVAASAGLPLAPFSSLARSALDDVAKLGPSAALTGPVRREDWEVVRRHREALGALDSSEIDGYDAGVRLASRLALAAGAAGKEAAQCR